MYQFIVETLFCFLFLGANGQNHKNKCSDGWTLCEASGDCVYDCGRYDSSSDKSCGPGKMYCISSNSCVPTCPNAAAFSSRSLANCPDEFTFCLSTMSCVPANLCDDSPMRLQDDCPQGFQLCIWSGKCTREGCGPAPNALRASRSCSSGQFFCLETQSCEENCNSKPNVNRPFKASSFLHPLYCSPGEIFCVSSGMCTRKDECKSQNPFRPSPTIKRCKVGEIFCLELGNCAREEDCQSHSYGGVHGQRSNPTIICPIGQTFCLSSGACSEVGNCKSRSGTDWGKMCPNGSIFCFENQECIPSDSKCSGDGSFIRCNDGYMFCASKGQCWKKDECDDKDLSIWKSEPKCPMIVNNFKSSDCITDHHCPSGYTCCPDAVTFHFKCVNASGDVAQNTLVSACNDMLSSPSDQITTDISRDCPSPENCPVGSLCCSEKCRAPRGKIGCTPSTLFCNYNSSCLSPGTKCGERCDPGTTFCRDGCRKPADCEIPHPKPSGAPWMLDGPLLVNSKGKKLPLEAKKLSDMFSADAKVVKLIVQKTSPELGKFQARKDKDEPWRTLEEGSEFQSSEFVRFVPEEGLNEFAVASMVVKEESSDIERFVVQLIAMKPPHFEFKMKIKDFNSLEDTKNTVEFEEIFSISDTDAEFYKKKNEAIDNGLPNKSAREGLIDSAHPSLKIWLDRLNQVNIGIASDSANLLEVSGGSPTPKRGISIEYKEKYSPPQKNPIVYLKLTAGKKRKKLVPGKRTDIYLSSHKKLANMKIYVNPRREKSGKETFILTPFIIDSLQGKPQMESFQPTEFVINVEAINDAPKAAFTASLKNVPKLDPSSDEMIFKARFLAKMFFTDSDEDEMGIAILFAPENDIGQWYYKTATAESYTPIDDLKDEKNRPKLSKISRYQGPISLKNLNSENRHKIYLNSITSRNSKPSNSYKSKPDGSFVTSDVEVPMLFLPPNADVKFGLKDQSKKLYHIGDAMNTGLIYFAWDATSGEEGDPIEIHRKNININKHEKRGGHHSLSLDAARLVIEMADCNGGSVLLDDELKVFDKCGVCGGDNSNCTDCMGVSHGTAEEICGDCVGGTSNLDRSTKAFDCIHSCEHNNVITSDTNICVHKKDLQREEENNSCNGVKGATLNKCGVCVSPGNFQTEATTNMDFCCVCNGTNECVGCDGVPFSGYILDNCGYCYNSTDPRFDTGCIKLSQSDRLTFDASLMKILNVNKESNGLTDVDSLHKLRKKLSALTINAKVIGLSSDQYTVKSCSLIDNTTKTVIFSIYSEVRGTGISLILKTLEAGKFVLSCTIILKNRNSASDNADANARPIKSEEKDISSSSFINIHDSSKVKIEKLDKQKLTREDNEITITLQNKDLDLSEALCLLSYPLSKSSSSKRKVLVFRRSKDSEDNEIKCKVTGALTPGTLEVSVLFTKILIPYLKRGDITLDSKKLTVEATAPKILKAKLDPPSRNLMIKFDKNINVVGKCEDAFVEKEILGENPICKVVASSMKITLGKGHKVKNGTKLSLVSSNKIHQKNSDPNSALGAAGQTFVYQNYVKKEPLFILIGKNTACNSTNITVRAIFDRRIDSDGYKMKWESNWVPPTEKLTQDETLLRWDSDNKLKAYLEKQLAEDDHDDRSISFPGDMLYPGANYRINAAVINDAESEGLSPQYFDFNYIPDGTNVLVMIKGPTKVYAHQKYKYSAKLYPCDDSIDVQKLRVNYFWDFNKDAKPLNDDSLSANIKLLPNTLRGGKEYTLYVRVVDIVNSNAQGLGSLKVTCLSRDPKVTLTMKRLRVGTNADFKIDGSRSRDLDGDDAKVSYRWECTIKSDGSGCYVFIDGVRSRFENTVPEEDIRSKVLEVPGSLLSANTYIFTLYATKNMKTISEQAVIEVVEAITPELYIEGPSGPVDASKKNKIKAWVTSGPVTSIEWSSVEDDGFLYVEVDDFTKPKVFKRKSKKRAVMLVIPKNVLNANALYKFRLSASANGGSISQGDAIISTKSPPIGGTFGVTPSSGEALITKFTYKADNWKDDPSDFPLTYQFGYRFKGEKVIVFITEGLLGEAEIILPSRDATSEIIPVAKISDATGSSTIVSAKVIKMELPDNQTFPTDFYDNVVKESAVKLESDDLILDGLLEIGDILDTLKAIGANELITRLIDFTVDKTLLKIEELRGRLRDNPEAVQETGAKIIGGTLANYKKVRFPLSSFELMLIIKAMIVDHEDDMDESEEIERASMRRAGSVRTATSEFLYPEDDGSLFDARNFFAPVHKDFESVVLDTDDGMNPTDREKRSYQSQNEMFSHAINRRFKRDAKKVKKTPEKKYTESSVKNFIKLDETRIKLSDKEQISSAKQRLIKAIPSYASGLCLSLSNGEEVEIWSDSVSFRVAKTDLSDNEANKQTAIVEVKDKITDRSSYVTFGSILEEFNEWKCNEDAEGTPCYGACYATYEFNPMFNSPTDDTETANFKPASRMILTTIHNPTNGHVIEKSVMKDETPILYEIAVKPGEKGFISKCYGWIVDEEEWDPTVCYNSDQQSTSVNTVNCYCKKTGFVSVFRIPNTVQHIRDTNKPTTGTEGDKKKETETEGDKSKPPGDKTKPAPREKRKISMRLDGNYGDVVEKNKAKFEETIKQQLLDIFNKECNCLTLANIIIESIRSGSIIVDFVIIETIETIRKQGQDGKSLDELYAFLMKALENGEITLDGVNNEKLKASVASRAANDPAYVPILIGGIVGGVLLIGIVIIIVAIYLNQKKLMNKVNPINGTLKPTYREFPFANSLDGGSFPNSKQGNMKPETYIGNGLIIERNSATKSSRADSGLGDDVVPDAFSYHEPSPKQLRDSQKIPPDILKKINAELCLPGSPDILNPNNISPIKIPSINH